MTLQLVYYRLGVALDIEEVDAAILAASHHTGPLSERHEGAEDAMNELGSMLDGEASLQL